MLQYINTILSIREQITPKGDGNLGADNGIAVAMMLIREQITPKGDGNFI